LTAQAIADFLATHHLLQLDGIISNPLNVARICTEHLAGA
jgi:hypothetical protein